MANQKFLVFDKTLSVRVPPINYNEKDLAFFAHEFRKQIGPTFALRLENCHILSDSLFCGYKFYFRHTHFYGKIPFISTLKRFAQLVKKREQIEKALWIIDDWSSGYFHWFCDALPRLIASEGLNPDLPIVLPDFYKSIAYVQQSLSILGREVIYYSPKSHIICKDLLVISHTSSSGNYNEKIILSLRNRFFKSDEPEIHNRKIFISRGKASRRKITNEMEVQRLMSSNGYEVHFFEDYSLQKQIKLLSSCEALVSLHGSGLTNLLFMRQGSVLELRADGDGHNNCYYSMASALHHRYFYQWCKIDSNSSGNVEVDLSALEKNLKLMAETV